MSNKKERCKNCVTNKKGEKIWKDECVAFVHIQREIDSQKKNMKKPFSCSENEPGHSTSSIKAVRREFC